MNSSGYSLDNIHLGDTFIEGGSLFVDGAIVADGSSGQSEYLDSGVYTPLFSNFLNINTVEQKTANNQKTIFTKNGNIITLDTNLDINYPALSSGTLTIFRFNMTVPSTLDILDAKILNQAPCITGSTEFGIVLTNAFYVSEGIFTIQLQAQTINIVGGAGSSLSLKLVYKLEGNDIPATAIVTSGGGTGGDVQNPMQSELDGGGFNIVNIQDLTAQGTVTANLINAPNVISNPLTSDLYTNGARIYNAQGNTPNIFVTSTFLVFTGESLFNNDLRLLGKIQATTTNLIIDNNNGTPQAITIQGQELRLDNTSGLRMFGNPITDIGSITSANNNITISPSNGGLPADVVLSGRQLQVSMNNGIDMLNHPIANCSGLGLKELNNVKLIRSEADFNGSTNLSGAYIIYGMVTLTEKYTLTGDTTITGIGRDISSLDFDVGAPGTDYCISNTDFNLEISNVNLSNASNEFSLLRCINNGKDKILTMTNCSIRNCENAEAVNITGFDLVDLNQVLFQYNNVASRHFRCQASSKLQVTSCEFLRQYTEGSNPVSYGSAPMIDLSGTFEAVNIGNNLIHPEQSQDGIRLQPAFNATESVIASNTFIKTNLISGVLLRYGAGSINNYPSLIVSDNTGIKNQKALLSANSQNNTTYTATVAGSYTPVDFGPNFIVDNDDRFSPTLNAFEFQYDANQPISCLVSVSVSADHDTKGDDSILFALEQNTVIASEYQVSIDANDIKSFTFTTVLTLEQDDILRFVVQNQTAGTNPDGFRAVSFIATLVEI